MYAVYEDCIHGAVFNNYGWVPILWNLRGGVWDAQQSPNDLLPPKLTRDEAIAECMEDVFNLRELYGPISRDTLRIATKAIITHWEKLKAEGRIDE